MRPREIPVTKDNAVWRARKAESDAERLLAQVRNDDRLLQRALERHDRARAHWWGRLLLWLLRKTT